MSRNVMFIESNPYYESIKYSWQFPNKIGSLSADSPLNTEKYMQTTIPHIAFDLIQYVKDNLYNKKYGMDIIFKGSRNDYDELCNIKEQYFADSDIEIKSDPQFTIDAKEAIVEINEIYDELYEQFNTYANEEINDLLNKYRESTKPEINIYVMGLYSSGKSAFINSLIGREILSSSGSAETAKIYRIIQSDNSRIMFDINGQECEIEFFKDSWRINENPDNEMALLIKHALDNDEYISEEKAIYKAIVEINGFAKENKDAQLGHIISIEIPFKKTGLPTNEFRFIINDTPGTNSEYFEDHRELLKSFMSEQTNGLPVFLTRSDNAQANDNKDIVSIIRELREILDISNSVLVVTQADLLDGEQCNLMREEKKSSIGKELKTDRLFFASSLVGLGAKKDDPMSPSSWNYREFAKNFKNVIGDFTDPAGEFYMDLPSYNMIPKNDLEELEKVKKEYKEDDLALWNSGIPAIEHEIGIFAQKYALYNKCRQAQQYLQKACMKLDEQIKEKNKETKEIKEDLEKDLSREMKDLRENIETLCNEHVQEYQTKYVNEIIQPKVSTITSEQHVKSKVTPIITAKKDRGKDEVNKAINEAIKNDMGDYAEGINKDSKDLWKDCEDSLHKKLISRIEKEPGLTEEQKNIIKNTMLGATSFSHMHWNITVDKAVQTKTFLFFIKYTKVDSEEIIKLYKNAIEKDLQRNNDTTLKTLKENIDFWQGKLENATVQAISTLNPELVSKTNHLKELASQIEDMEKQVRVLSNSRVSITTILNKEA